MQKAERTKQLISLVIPVYNEAEGIAWLHEELLTVLRELHRFHFEIVYVNDGSKDTSLEVLMALQPGSNTIIKVVELSRNFGKEAALSAGLAEASGQAALSLDSDGQHPLSFIKRFIQKWEEGTDVVIGVRGKNEKEGFIKRYGSRAFYRMFNKLAGTEMVPKSTDFRLIDRKVIDEFNKLSETNRITRGLIDWLGYKRDYIYFDANARQFGTATYTVKKLIQLAMNTFVSLSSVPLFFAGYLGVFFMLVGLFGGVFILIEQILLGDPLSLQVTGTAMLGVLITFLVGMILSAQGLIGLYMSRVLSESQGRPLYVIRTVTRSKNKQ